MSTYQQLLSQKAALAKQQADIERQRAALSKGKKLDDFAV